MRNPSRDLPSSCVATLLVLTAGCSKANFVPITDGADGAGDAVVAEDAADAADSGFGPEAAIICPAPSVSGCAPNSVGRCDPVCQTGACDWCTEKCTYAYGGGGPVPTCASKGAGTVSGACKVVSAGSSQQVDDCAPGNICLAPMIGDNLTYCFILCRSASDCPYVQCGQRKLSAAGGFVDVCDPPYDQCGKDGNCCNPLTDSGCDANRFCLLVSPDGGSGHSRTVCEYAYGDGRNGSPCNSARDCQTRNTCVNNACMQVCDTANSCPAGGTCNSLGSEYGYCS